MRWWLAERLVPYLSRDRANRFGQGLYEQREFTRAMPFLARAARLGHPAAQLRVGQLYLRGEGVPPSRVDAARWLRAAAEANVPEAQLAYANLLWSVGIQVDRFGVFAPDASSAPDANAAIRWATRAADSGLPEAQALLGQMLCFGPAELRDATRGETLFRQAVRAGSPDGSLGLALLLHRRAADTPEVVAESRQLFAFAAEGGSVYALFCLAVLVERSAQSDGELREAANLYRDAARRGHRGAQARWGVLLFEGRGCAQQPVEGESWLRKAALAGDQEAACWLGDHYARPGDLPPNLIEAAAWYRRAAELGHATAAHKLGLLHAEDGPEHDPEQAATWFRQAAALGQWSALADLRRLIVQGIVPEEAMTETLAQVEAGGAAGDADAALRLGQFFSADSGGCRDDARAARWFKVAADSLPAGQYWYGRMLERQANTAAEQAEARGWIDCAAKSGMVEAKAVLAQMMLHGRGGPRDPQQALSLFEDAASAGHLGAIFALGVLYAGVDGISPNLALSEVRLREAAERGHAPAQLQLGKFLSAGHYGAADPDGAAEWFARAQQGGLATE